MVAEPVLDRARTAFREPGSRKTEALNRKGGSVLEDGIQDAEARCGELLERSLDEVFADPGRAVRTARQALRLAEGLAAAAPTASSSAAARWADLQGRAWAAVGNAERVAADLDAAAAAMRRAEACLTAGSGDPWLAARLLDLKASLACTAGQLDEALSLIDDAVAAYLRLGDGRDEDGQGHGGGLGRSLVKKAVYLAHAGDTERAVDVLHQAFEHLVPRRDQRSVLAATQCLAFCLHRMGYDIPAAQLVDQALVAVRDSGDRVLLLRLEWQKVRIRMGLGHDGEGDLRRIRDALLDEGLVYDAALACLDLAAYYARRRRLPDLQALALEMFPIYNSREIHREALSALLLLRDRLSGGRADVAYLEALRAFLEDSRYDRRRKFQWAAQAPGGSGGGGR